MAQTISVEQLEGFGPSVQLVDVRSPSEYATGHIPGALNIPMEQVESRLQDLDVSGQVVLVCQAGTRAQIVAERLASCGMKLVVLAGGTQSWINAGRPVVASVRSRWSLERQVRFGAGVLVLASVVLASIASAKWIFLAGFVGLGLTFAGLTDICPMAMMLGKMPWNRTSQCPLPKRA